MGSGSPSNLNKMVIFTAMVMVLYYIMVLETRPIVFVNKDKLHVLHGKGSIVARGHLSSYSSTKDHE